MIFRMLYQDAAMAKLGMGAGLSGSITAVLGGGAHAERGLHATDSTVPELLTVRRKTRK